MPEKPFYRIPASMGPEQKCRVLLDAFDAGAVVIMDEINSSPLLERLLNQLLSGTRAPEPPETDIRFAKKPGFTLIGTQNPASMAGRRLPSNALARRLLTLVVPEYPAREIVNILVCGGLSPEKSQALVGAFELVCQRAAHQHSPAPTFRDILRAAKILARENSVSFLAKEDAAPCPKTKNIFSLFETHHPVQQQDLQSGTTIARRAVYRG